MSLFHTHQWREQSRVHVPPYTGHAKGLDADTALRLVSGFTSIVQRCDGCGELKTTKVLGDHTPCPPSPKS